MDESKPKGDETETPALKRRGPRGSRPDRILSAALTLFRQKGFAGTSMNDIGKETGISGPALYRHFSSKEDILAATFHYAMHKVARGARIALSEERPPHLALTALCQSLVEVVVHEPGLMALLLLERSSLPESDLLQVRRQDRIYREEFVHLLTALKPELNDNQARTRVVAGIYSVVSVCFEDALLNSDEQIEQLTLSMLGCLTGG